MSVPGQPRPDAVVLPVSTMLMERCARKPGFAHWLVLAVSIGRGLSDSSPHWLEVRNTLSEESVGRQERDDRENDKLLRGCPMHPGDLMVRLRDGSGPLWSLKSRFSNCLHIISSKSVNWLRGKEGILLSYQKFRPFPSAPAVIDLGNSLA